MKLNKKMIRMKKILEILNIEKEASESNSKLPTNANEVLNNHIGTEEQNFQCPFECPQSSNSADEMFAHICINHRLEKREIFRISTIRFLKNLEMKVSKKCVPCNKAGYCTTQKLNEHYGRYHANDSGWEWCSLCNKSIRNLKKHLESSIHSTERKFNCEICGHMYGTQIT